MFNEAMDVIERAKKDGRKILLEPEAKTICRIYGIPVTKFKVAKSEEEAVKFAKEIGFPVVLKIVSPDVIHKSDVGGVYINIKNEEEVREKYRIIINNVKKHIPNARIYGIFVQEMAPEGIEVIVGGLRDPQFGPTIMFGLGGIFVEVLKDVSFRIVPITRMDAEEMIHEIKGYKLLEGYRMGYKADIESIIDILLKVSSMMEELPIKELDLNPIFVYEKGAKVGAKVIDARMVVE